MESKTLTRLYAEKKAAYAVEAAGILNDLKEHFGLLNLEAVRVLNRYDVEGLTEAELASAKEMIFSEAPVDEV